MQQGSGHLPRPAIHRPYLDTTRHPRALEFPGIAGIGSERRKVGLGFGVLPGESGLDLGNVDIVCSFGGWA